MAEADSHHRSRRRYGQHADAVVIWNVITRVEYLQLDTLDENICFTVERIPQRAQQASMSIETNGQHQPRVFDMACEVRVILELADVFESIPGKPSPVDLWIAHAFLDIIPMPENMTELPSLIEDLAWLTIYFDAATPFEFEPMIDSALDAAIEKLYHDSMDKRPTGGDNRAGRHLFPAFLSRKRWHARNWIPRVFQVG